jgi:hypothetical protein
VLSKNALPSRAQKNRAVELLDLLCKQLFKKGDVAQRVDELASCIRIYLRHQRNKTTLSRYSSFISAHQTTTVA